MAVVALTAAVAAAVVFAPAAAFAVVVLAALATAVVIAVVLASAAAFAVIVLAALAAAVVIAVVLASAAIAAAVVVAPAAAFAVVVLATLAAAVVAAVVLASAAIAATVVLAPAAAFAVVVLAALAAAVVVLVMFDPFDLDFLFEDLALELARDRDDSSGLGVRPDQTDSPSALASRIVHLEHQGDLLAHLSLGQRNALDPYGRGGCHAAGDALPPEGHTAPHGLLAAHDSDRDGVAGGMSRHRFHQAVHVDDRGAPDVEQDVLGLKSGSLRRTAFHDRGDGHAVLSVGHRDAHVAALVGRGRGLADVDRHEHRRAAVGEIHETQLDCAGGLAGGHLTRVPDLLKGR